LMILRKLKIVNLPLEGSFVIYPMVFNDERGEFRKLYTEDALKSKNVSPYFPEEYISVSKKWVIRGLHYQLGQYSQAKFVRCARGEVYDVIVDLRRKSPTFARWHGIILSEKNMISIYVPRGFAHGFMSLTEGAQLHYKTDNRYMPESERGIIWNDPDLRINWPSSEKVIVSEKDANWPSFRACEKFE